MNIRAIPSILGIGLLVCTGLTYGQDVGPGKQKAQQAPPIENPVQSAPVSSAPGDEFLPPQSIIQHRSGGVQEEVIGDLPPWDEVHDPQQFPLATGSNGKRVLQKTSGGYAGAGHGYGEAGQTAKYSQPVDCEQSGYFSNINSNLNPFVRYDDFTCNATGFITQVVFWGAGWDLALQQPCKTLANVSGFQIDFYDWVEDSQCKWKPGRLLSSTRLKVSELLSAQYECDDPLGGQQWRMVAQLPTPFFQRMGQQYGISISAILIDSDDPCIFYWNSNPNQIDCLGFSEDRLTGDICVSPQDMSFELITERIDVVKYLQPPMCENGFSFFSNLNSNLNPFLRYDDFICTATGDITTLNFWGGGWDVTVGGCDLSNIRGFQVEVYDWVQGGTCNWQPGKELCNEYFPLQELDPQPECTDGAGMRVFNFTANFKEPCFQEAGRHYAIRIAADLIDPDNPCIFAWNQTEFVLDSAAYSEDKTTGDRFCDGPDMSFELTTEPQDVVKYAQPLDCTFIYFSNLNSNANPFLHYDDFTCTQTGLIDRVNWWGGPWAPGCDQSNIAGFEINIYEWVADSGVPCGWRPGKLLCNNFVTLAETQPTFECDGPNGERHFRYEAELREKCFQAVGRQYAIRIAAVVLNPDDPCYWGWSRTPNTIDGTCYSEDRNNPGQICIQPDAAFELVTEACRVQYFEFGTGLAGSGGFVPQAFGTDGTCDKGGHFLHVSDALGGTLSVLWIGSVQGITPLKGGTLYLNLGFPFTLIPINLFGPPGVPGAGFINIPGPDVSAFKGLTVYMQFTISDRGAVRGVSLTNAVQMSIY